MSTEEQTSIWSRPFMPYLIVGGVLVLIGVGLVVALSTIGPPSVRTALNPTTRVEEPLENLREALARSADLGVCRQAVQQMNDYLRRASGDAPRALTETQRDFLKNHLALDADELTEVSSGSFTPLDAHHLDLCFLLRDALRGLQGEEGTARPARPTESQIAAAFAWVVRQVQVQERPGELPVPPQFVLRRGWGSALERSLIFLALLQQMGVPGCLVILAEAAGSRLWACGALADRGDGRQVLLFDPRLGLPLPGAKGEGVATLAEVRAQPDLLKQLTVDDKYPYDVTAEQAATAEIHLVCPLSAVAPRMKYLEAKLQDPDPSIKAPPVHVKLSADAQELFGQFEAAVGKGTPVKVHAGLSKLLRYFLPTDEGGVDRSDRLNRFRSELIPWERLPPEVRDLPGDPGQRLQSFFGGPFIQLVLEPQRPRDLMLRGDLKEAVEQLTKAMDELRHQKGDALPPDWREQVAKWREEINRAHAELIRAERAAGKEGTASPAVTAAREEVMKVWKAGGRVLIPLLQTSTAEPRGLQLTYFLALCKHEQAEQLQARLERGRKPDRPADKRLTGEAAAVRSAWQDAALWWVSLTEAHPAARETAGARRLHARARAMLGETERAVAILQDLSGPLTDHERTAQLYLARQLKDRKP
ncbi:MAG TPA: hypothetical protein VNK04_04485 [Gemmataceae bacterium]|nr:hypothetical protein [Gemmataceae bacterium]